MEDKNAKKNRTGDPDDNLKINYKAAIKKGTSNALCFALLLSFACF